MATVAPTKPSGYVEDAVYWSAALADFAETVPEATWPQSNWTFAMMRRDPQLAAVLKAYTLPIRRASWMLDPAGCRPEVVQLVADDLGLPVKGTDEPGAARVRGVSWHDHLRAALAHLTYGHMPFEQLAEIRDGRARLVSMSERMPYTIGQIEINRDGSLAGISQIPLPGDLDDTQIPVSRLVWYVNDREGAAWQGTSLLRPAYAPWLFKREMQRVLATSNRRFGMGVPTVRALPGTIPTPAQEQAAMQLAASIRVGEQSGASVPPGYVLELVGLTGSVPDTKGFIDWLNQEMSRMALTGFLDLGQTPNGSRALGESFVNLFLLAIQAIADDIADTATRQAAARLVEWNWGEDEPVPAVVVGDVGSSHQVTAEAIEFLVRHGAIQPDPALDAWLRREYRIPARTIPFQEPLPAPTPTEPGPTHNATAPAPAPSPARRKPRRTPAASRQAPLPFAAASVHLRRDLTDVEAASGADFDAIQQQYLDTRTALQQQWPTLAGPVVAALAAGAGTAVAAGALGDLGTLTVKSGVIDPIVAVLLGHMTTLAEQAAADVVAEAAAQGVTLTAGTVDTGRLAQAATAAAQVIVSGYANGAARTAMLHAGTTTTADTVSTAVTTSLDAMSSAGDTGWVATNLGGALSLAQHAGRMATYATAPVTPALTASEVLDNNCCDPCSEIDGTEFTTVAEADAAYPSGRYVGCLGADRCRGQIVGRWTDGGTP